MISMLYKNTLLKIKKSFGRYLSILIIVLIGVGFYAGIQATAPDITQVADDYFDTHRLTDFKIVSSLGLTDADLSALSSLEGVEKAVASYSLDALCQEDAVRFHALEDTINTVSLLSGRMPQTEQECVADGANYQTGDILCITGDVDGQIKTTSFTVVGTVQSVLYLSDDYGSSTVGDGTLSSYAFIPKSNFTMEAYTEIYLIVKGTADTMAYSKEYDALTAQAQSRINGIKAEREEARYTEIYDDAKSQLDTNEQTLLQEKADGQKQLDNAKAQLQQNSATLEQERQRAQAELDQAKLELDANAKRLNQGKAELASAEASLAGEEAQQREKLTQAKEQLDSGYTQIDGALEQAGLTRGELGGAVQALTSSIEQQKALLLTLTPGSEEYLLCAQTLAQYQTRLEDLTALSQSLDTLNTQQAALRQGLAQLEEQMAQAKAELKSRKEELTQGENSLADGYNQYYQNLQAFTQQMDTNQQKLEDGYRDYQKSLDTFTAEMAKAEAKLASAKEDLKGMEHAQWHVSGRDVAVGYTRLQSGIDTITSVAAIFPLFFMLIVMLMTSNAMARMIVEERGELGTLLSLGYSGGKIISTYLLYVLSATGIGASAGFFLGCTVIPPLIYSNFLYNMPPLVLRFDLLSFWCILAAAFLLMALVTLFACHRELHHQPARLMRPLPPKKGQTILLQRVTWVWKRLSFTWKVTMRNLFRYKKRGLMTVVGVAGCTALLLVGFGLRDSMNGVAGQQYGALFTYDQMVVLKNGTDRLSDTLKEDLTSAGLTAPLLIQQAAYQVESEQQNLDVMLLVPQNTEEFEQYYHLQSMQDGTPMVLDEEGVIVTRKIAELFGVQKGSSITVKDGDNRSFTLPVSGVAQNYISSYLYMTPSLYQKLIGEQPLYNAVVAGYAGGDDSQLAAELLQNGQVVNAISSRSLQKEYTSAYENLQAIILLLLVVASMLAVIVLYNLTSINISERTREIATLKVLGFRDKETNSYIYREAILLSLVSVAVGLLLGVILHRVVMGTIEDQTVSYFRTIKWYSFVFSGVITLFFTLLMQVITYFKLKTIDMVESLKSVE